MLQGLSVKHTRTWVKKRGVCAALDPPSSCFSSKIYMRTALHLTAYRDLNIRDEEFQKLI